MLGISYFCLTLARVTTVFVPNSAHLIAAHARRGRRKVRRCPPKFAPLAQVREQMPGGDSRCSLTSVSQEIARSPATKIDADTSQFPVDENEHWRTPARSHLVTRLAETIYPVFFSRLLTRRRKTYRIKTRRVLRRLARRLKQTYWIY